MSIELDEGALTSRKFSGPNLYYCAAMPPAGELKAMLGMLHGYADHCGRYSHVMGALAEHGIGSVMIDLRGHGRAGGERGYCSKFSEFIDDARELRALVDARAKSVPTFLFGHSFGGLIAATLMLEGESGYKGLLLSSPFFAVAMEVPKVKILAGKIASRVLPTLGLPSGLSGKDMTHDAEKAKAYDNDPLVFKNATARWFTETVAAQERALASASRLSIPMKMSFGTKDAVVGIDAAKRFFDAAGSADKTWDAREGLYHELFSEPSWKELVEVSARWILARV